MKDEELKSAEKIAGLVVALLLILTAWGSAMAMFIVSGVVLVVGLLVARRNLTPRAVIAAVIGCIVAFAVAFVIQA
jgi:hypothetical protein